MHQKFRPELEQEERKKILQSQAFEIKEETHFRQLSEDELYEVMKAHIENSRKITKLEEEAKEAMKVFKDKLETLKDENYLLNDSYHTRTAEITEKVYCMDDQEGGWMYIYNEKGDLISSRRLKADEKDNNGAKLTIMTGSRAVGE